VNKKSDDEDGRGRLLPESRALVEAWQQIVSRSYPFRAGGPNAQGK